MLLSFLAAALLIKPKARKTDTAPYKGILGSRVGSNHDVKNSELLFL